MKEFEAKVRLNEENGGKTGELDIMSQPPFDKGYFNGVTFGITFKEPVFEAEKKSEWIPCSERLPEEGTRILFCDIDGDVYCGERYYGGAWWDDRNDDHVKNVIAWMPLPEPYKQSESAGRIVLW